VQTIKSKNYRVSLLGSMSMRYMKVTVSCMCL